MTQHGKRYREALGTRSTAEALYGVERGGRPGQGDGLGQVRRDRRAGRPPRRRPPQGRPDRPGHAVAAVRDRAGPSGSPSSPPVSGRRGPQRRGRRRRRRRPRRPGPRRGLLGLRRRHRHPGPDGPGRHARPGPRPRGSDAEPEDRHGHHGRRPRRVGEFKAGRVEYRTDKVGNIHIPVGKVSFTEAQLVANVHAVVEELVRAKPAGGQGPLPAGGRPCRRPWAPGSRSTDRARAVDDDEELAATA